MADPSSLADLEAELARVAARESSVRAWVIRHDDDRLRASIAGGPAGPLQGWTLGVKDVIDTADLPTERGSPIHAGRAPGVDASCVALARRAGAVVVGKTVTTEFAYFTPAATTNPHDPTRTPGGSSSGSAAAVADGMVRAAFGTQTVGSVIRPASFCGVVGFKPTRGLVPTTGVAHLAPSLDTVGWLTRSVADAAILLAVLGGPASAGGVPTAAVRLGRYRSHQWESAQPELAGLLDRAADRLADAGVDVVDLEPLPHLDGAFEVAATVLSHEVPRALAWEWDHHPDLVSPPVAAMLERPPVPLAGLAAAHLALEAAGAAHRSALHRLGVDALLTPSAPGEAPTIDTTGDSAFNRVWTALGVPAVTVPAGSGPAGLPIGLQLVGSTWGDHHLLAVAEAVAPVLADGERTFGPGATGPSGG